MHEYEYAAAATVLAVVAKGNGMMQILNVVAPLTIVAVIGVALFFLQRWRRGRQRARPEEDSGGWTSQHTSE
jgi:hypothetical protein